MKLRSFFSFPRLPYAIWLLAMGRFLSEVGTGFILFYTPIFFVNEVGLSSTLVGIALGSASVSGVVGRFLGGSLSDSPHWGRRKTLLSSALISAIADLILAFSHNFSSLVFGNLLMGFGMGLYWPANETMVADLTTGEQRNEAFAMTRLADSLGLSLGVMLGGIIITTSQNYRLLFIIDSVSFLLFFLLIYFTIKEPKRLEKESIPILKGWQIAFKDSRLRLYFIANIFFTTYLAQLQTTLPLYFKNFTSDGGFTAAIISALFSWYIVSMAISQLPIARFLNRFNRINALRFSLLFWGLGFSVIWLTGILATSPLILAIIGLGILAIATVSYTPSASSLVAEIAPANLLGIYFSINAQCWAIGYFIGPLIGGFILDQSPLVIKSYWLIVGLSVCFCLVIFSFLEKMMPKSST
ncbi:MFS transporter [Chroococcus sp. FPU101]|uniref:MDR family MFS transporter n=1 Tax=Chroococcus sp. FPU101 TaxID=1974212 RepID=UPI001A901409|nr:MFS transporter [Chroococcus sp. FPU101]GFE69748.1 transporter, major facilitator superfamily [Chroococcus sp. FPU101]